MPVQVDASYYGSDLIVRILPTRAAGVDRDIAAADCDIADRNQRSTAQDRCRDRTRRGERKRARRTGRPDRERSRR